jgi:hypothetical protein
MNRMIFLAILGSLLAACGSSGNEADTAPDTATAVDTTPPDPCPGYTGARSCCAVGDPCGLAGDRVCDCDGACDWDLPDCDARCAADGVCVMECPADPDCAAATPCACDHASGRCETDAPCSAAPCACDPDCASASPCAADDTCDPRCPQGVDPDCAGSAQDGRECCTPACTGKLCGDDGCGGTCGTCPASYGCYDGRCLVDEGCGVITDWGCCQGDVAIWCDGGELWQVDCGAEDPPTTCGWDAEAGYYCGGSGVDPDGIVLPGCIYEPCTPSCAGKECGGDGCNGSCGDCAEGEVCKNGTCRAR